MARKSVSIPLRHDALLRLLRTADGSYKATLEQQGEEPIRRTFRQPSGTDVVYAYLGFRDKAEKVAEVMRVHHGLELAAEGRGEDW